MSTTQDSQTTFKLNLTCIFLSARARYLMCQNLMVDPVRPGFRLSPAENCQWCFLSSAAVAAGPNFIISMLAGPEFDAFFTRKIDCTCCQGSKRQKTPHHWRFSLYKYTNQISFRTGVGIISIISMDYNDHYKKKHFLLLFRCKVHKT